MNAPDLNAMAERLEVYIRSLRNDVVSPAEPLVLDVFDLIDDGMRNMNTPHPMPWVGFGHEDEDSQPNPLLSGGFETAGHSTWFFIVMCDSPVRGQGMRGPRGAMTISGLLKDGLNNFHVDGEEGACPMTVTRRKRFTPPEENIRAACGYILLATHPIID